MTLHTDLQRVLSNNIITLSGTNGQGECRIKLAHGLSEEQAKDFIARGLIDRVRHEGHTIFLPSIPVEEREAREIELDQYVIDEDVNRWVKQRNVAWECGLQPDEVEMLSLGQLRYELEGRVRPGVLDAVALHTDAFFWKIKDTYFFDDYVYFEGCRVNFDCLAWSQDWGLYEIGDEYNA